MTVKELKEALAAYPDDMEVVVDRMEYDDSEHIYDTEFHLENQRKQPISDRLMTPTNQKPSECKHYQEVKWGCFAQRWCRNKHHCTSFCNYNRGPQDCPDYQPKEKKDNE